MIIVDGTLTGDYFLTDEQKLETFRFICNIGIKYVQVKLQDYLLLVNDLKSNRNTTNRPTPNEPELIVCIDDMVQSANNDEDNDRKTVLNGLKTVMITVTQKNIQVVKRFCIDNPNINIVICVDNGFTGDYNVLSGIVVELEELITRICIRDKLGIATHTQVEDVLTLIQSISSNNIDIQGDFWNTLDGAVYNTCNAVLHGCEWVTTSIVKSAQSCANLYKVLLRVRKLYQEITTGITGVITDVKLITPKSQNDLTDPQVLTTFLKYKLPDVYQHLNDTYINKLADTVSDDITKTPFIKKILQGTDQEKINYLMKYIG